MAPLIALGMAATYFVGYRVWWAALDAVAERLTVVTASCVPASADLLASAVNLVDQLAAASSIALPAYAGTGMTAFLVRVRRVPCTGYRWRDH
jgi:hypothetical protein